MARIIPSAHSARHVAAAEAIDLDGDDISDAARAIYDAPATPVLDLSAMERCIDCNRLHLAITLLRGVCLHCRGRKAGILADYGDAVDAVELPGAATQVWLRYRAQLATLPAADREAAWKALCKKTEEVGKMKNVKVWLKKAIAEEDARRATATDPGPLDDPPSGGAGGASGGGKAYAPRVMRVALRVERINGRCR